MLPEFFNLEPPVIDRRLLASAACLLLVGAVPAVAQDMSSSAPAPAPAASDAEPAPDFGKDTLTVGVLGAYIPDYEGSNDYRFTPAPVVIGSLKGFNFTFIGNRGSLDLIPNRPGSSIDLQLGPIAKVNFNRSTLSQIDDVRVRALGKRATSLSVGGFVGIAKTGVITSAYDRIAVSVSYRQGVAGANRSYTWEPSVTYATPLSRKLGVLLTASASYSGDGYANTYYSVSPGESLASGLPTFTAHKGWRDYTVGGLVTYSITGDLLHGFKLVAGGSYTRQMNDFSYSPLVRIAGSPNQWLGSAGIAYTF